MDRRVEPDAKPAAQEPTGARRPWTDFASSRALFEAMLNGLEGEAAGWSHGEMEEWLDAKARELQRQMYQDSLDLRALREARLEAVVGAEGCPEAASVGGHEISSSPTGLMPVWRRAWSSRRRSRSPLSATASADSLALTNVAGIPVIK